MHVLLLHARIDSRIFLFVLLDMPARQSVFDLAVRPRVLLKHGDPNSVIGQNFRSHRTRNRTANYGHEMMPRIGHMPAAPPAHGSALYNAIAQSVSIRGRIRPDIVGEAAGSG
jgi:hypothetical protein